MPFKDKDEARDYMRRYRQNQTAEQKAKATNRVKERKREIQEWFRAHKESLKCSRCPEDFWACLEFHHRDGSEKEIVLSRVFEKGWSIQRIEKEMAKCDVLCANCHRKEHFA